MAEIYIVFLKARLLPAEDPAAPRTIAAQTTVRIAAVAIHAPNLYARHVYRRILSGGRGCDTHGALAYAGASLSPRLRLRAIIAPLRLLAAIWEMIRSESL